MKLIVLSSKTRETFGLPTSIYLVRLRALPTGHWFLALALAFGLLPLTFRAGAGAAVAAAASSARGERFFVCAHSFMIFTAKLLPEIAQAAGVKHIAAGQQMIGGSRVIQHWNLPDEQNKAKAALRAGEVDVLTLSPHMLLPDDGIDNFVKLGLEKNPKLRVLVQASWPARDGVVDNKFRNEDRDASTIESLRKMHVGHGEWLRKLEAQVRALNQSAGREAVFIVPASEAIFALRERLVEGKAPGLKKQSELFRDPLGHPNAQLAQLVAYCHFATIYKRSPVGLPVPAALKSLPQAVELNRLLQELAWDAVVNYPMSGVKGTEAK